MVCYTKLDLCACVCMCARACTCVYHLKHNCNFVFNCLLIPTIKCECQKLAAGPILPGLSVSKAAPVISEHIWTWADTGLQFLGLEFTVHVWCPHMQLSTSASVWQHNRCINKKLLNEKGSFFSCIIITRTPIRLIFPFLYVATQGERSVWNNLFVNVDTQFAAVWRSYIV